MSLVLNTPLAKEIATTVRTVPDFPRPGIQFKDISPLLASPTLWRKIIKDITDIYRGLSIKIDKVVGMDARGFLIGIAVAMELGVGFVMARKPSKLPGKRNTVAYGLEYGKDSLEMEENALSPGDRVLIVDDLLATGGTAWAAGKLVTLGGGKVVGYAFIIHLADLGGDTRLAKEGYAVYSCCAFK